MNDSRYIIFDFDGTIADTFDLALEIYNRIAPEYNCRPAGPDDLDLFRITKPQELLKIYGVSRLKLLSLMLRIRKELSSHIPEINLIKGMEASLKEISGMGYRMGILTSNSVYNVSNFLDINNLSDLFDFIYSGRSLFGKEKVIRRLLMHEQLSADRVIYVGDETRDIEASKNAGIPVVAVSWGLNRREVLSSLSPDQIADDPKELPACLHHIIKSS
ncbi:MAG: HAD-IA family hydrolase [Bacteroidales bacterium]|nr:HAD-IA family hydrolase [Bacteroidales bacterium]